MVPALRRRRRTAARVTTCPPLHAGLMQADREGQVWLCEAVIRNGDVADYFLVRLSRLVGGDPVGDPVVLSPTEYETFSLHHGLQAVLL